MAEGTVVELIYCAAGNQRLAEIAVAHGFHYGAQLPGTVYTDVAAVYFADQDWKKPNRAKYMAALARHRPHMATVLDWDREEQLPEVLDWAEEAAQYVRVVVVIPKVFGGIRRLPRTIGGAEVRLGYSVPTRYGGTQVPVWEFGGWPVHLLGGSPAQQMRLAHYLDVVSADGNMAQLMATSYCAFWRPGRRPFTNSWPSILQADGQEWGNGGTDADAPYEAFRRSCQNIMSAWHKWQIMAL